jgi:serine/threonine-protein kinase
MTASQPGDAFQPGEVLNNTYRIEAILGRGGTSEVYRARSEINGRVVALKVLSAEFSRNDDFLGLMIREEEIREVRHDAVLRYSEINRSADGHVYLVMDYIDGPGLDQKLRAGGMSAEDLMVVARRVADGLVATHARNIVHRDLSPDNIILRGGDPAAAVIIDYGIAKDANPGAATIVGNEFAGKYAYAAPEQLNGRADARSDIYALGALLLATFRGKPPDVGRNPMEVVRRKAEPLDTAGVPEPLRGLIERMTDPDPDRRFQSAKAVIDAIDPAAATVPPPAAAPVRAPAPAPAAERPVRRGGAGRFAALAAALVVLVGIGAYLGGFADRWLAPGLPLVSPYTLVAEKPAVGPVVAAGHLPTEAAKAAFDAAIARMGGAAEVTLAAGDVPEDWGARVLDLVTAAAPLDEWRVAASGLDVEVTGLTLDRALRDAVTAGLEELGAASGLRVAAAIALGPRILPVADVEATLAAAADCGPLRAVDPPAGGYALAERVAVAGALSSEAALEALTAALAGIAGDRPVVADVDVQNAELCMVQDRLPVVPSGGFEVTFADGATGVVNADGVFPVGSNPVIDVVIPAEITDGSMWVTLVDVGGNAYHMLPNSQRPGNSVRDLRAGREGDVPVRVAFTLAERRADPDKLAFNVDDTLGASKVLVVFYTGELFEELRPTTESVASYAQALEERLRDPALKIHSISSRIFRTG